MTFIGTTCRRKDGLFGFLKWQLITLVVAHAVHLLLCLSGAQSVLLTQTSHWGFDAENNIRCETQL